MSCRSPVANMSLSDEHRIGNRRESVYSIIPKVVVQLNIVTTTADDKKN